MSTTFLTISSSQTQKTGRNLAKEILKLKPEPKAVVIGLVGDLGGGKTTFLQGFALGLNMKEKITSPTFVILKRFAICSSRFKNFYHFDCYRIQKPKEISDLGFKEIVADPENIVAVEWADKIKRIMPLKTIWLNFNFIDDKTRKIMIQLSHGK